MHLYFASDLHSNFIVPLLYKSNFANKNKYPLRKLKFMYFKLVHDCNLRVTLPYSNSQRGQLKVKLYKIECVGLCFDLTIDNNILTRALTVTTTKESSFHLRIKK